MSDILADSLDGVERRSLADFTENAYLNSSMYVIMDRALPRSVIFSVANWRSCTFPLRLRPTNFVRGDRTR